MVPVEFAFPGALRDYLLAAIRSGTKTATASLAREYEVGGEPLPVTGQRGTVIDSDGNGSFIIETSEVQIVRLDDVPLDHALAEGEGYESVAEWRAGHTQFWTSVAMRTELGDEFVLTGASLVVLERFIVVR
ncbi:ASCH domain-containing protein [Arthrobacter flavus]